MVATLLKLKGRLLANSLKRETWRLVLTLLGVLYGLGVMAMLAVAAFFLRDEAPDLLATGALAAGVLLTFGWVLVPMLAFGVDDSLDPARFALFTVPSTALALGLALAGGVTLPGLFFAFGLLVAAVIWSTGLLTVLAWLVSAVAGLATCLLLARATTTAAASWLSSRHGRSLMAVLGMLLLFGVVLVPTLAERLDSTSAWETVSVALAVASWTPFGAAWAVAGDVATGQGLAALAHLAVALAWLAGLFWAWKRLMGHAMTARTESPATTSRSRAGAYTLPGRLRGALRLPMPAAAVAARALRYWRTDPRYLNSASGALLFGPVVGFFLWFLPQHGPGLGVTLVIPIFVALFAGWGMNADTGFDSTALWMHVTAGISGRDDRLGRVVAVALWLVPVVIALTIGACALAGRWDAFAPILGGSLGLLAAGLAVSLVVSGLVVYPVQPPGANPFSSPGMGSVGLTMVVQTAAGAVTVAVASPLVVTMILGLVVAPAWGWVSLGLGIAGGAGLVVLGVSLGGKALDARAPAHLQTIRGWSGH